jgi:hypothetical protein
MLEITTSGDAEPYASQESENPMTAMSAITSDPSDLQRPSLPQLVQALNQARHQFLEAKRRYLKLRELVRLRSMEERRGLQELEELARLSPLPQEKAQAQAQTTRAETDIWSRLNQELNDNTLWLRTLKELLLKRLTRLCHQQRAVRRRAGAQAVQEWRQTPGVRDQLVQLPTLKKMIELREALRLRQLHALSLQNDTASHVPPHGPDHDLVANTTAEASRQNLGSNNKAHQSEANQDPASQNYARPPTTAPPVPGEAATGETRLAETAFARRTPTATIRIDKDKDKDKKDNREDFFARTPTVYNVFIGSDHLLP